MENDDLTAEIDLQINQLQEKLKGRLKETQDLGDLSNTVFKSSIKINKKTSSLKATSKKTKYKWLIEYMKWVGLLIIIISLLLLILIKNFI